MFNLLITLEILLAFVVPGAVLLAGLYLGGYRDVFAQFGVAELALVALATLITGVILDSLSSPLAHLGICDFLKKASPFQRRSWSSERPEGQQDLFGVLDEKNIHAFNMIVEKVWIYARAARGVLLATLILVAARVVSIGCASRTNLQYCEGVTPSPFPILEGIGFIFALLGLLAAFRFAEEHSNRRMQQFCDRYKPRILEVWTK